MVSIDFWVEGVSDQKFLADVLSKWFGLECTPTEGKNIRQYQLQAVNSEHQFFIRASGSVSSFISEKAWMEIMPDFKDNTKLGIKNVIIADADKDFESRIDEITKTVTEVGFNPQSDLYLWPANQADESGNLETLLEQIITDEHQGIISCFNDYETCLRSKNATYVTPNQKAKMYAYAEALGIRGKEADRDYTNENHWNLNPDHPPLKPLHEFLKRHLDNN